MALSFIQWEKYIQGFPDDRLGQEFKDPGSTVPGPEKPPQGLVVAEMGNRNAARQADEAMRSSQGQPSGTIAEQTYDEFTGGDRPVGGPGGGGPFPGGPPGGGPPGGPPMGPGGPPPGGPPPGGPPPGGPPMGGPPPGGPPMGGPPMGGPPMGGPPMMAHGGLIPGYEEGGFWSGLGRMTTGAGSWKDAAENPFRTLGHSALTGMMFLPGVGLVGAAGRAGARGIGALLKGERATKGLRKLGGHVLGLEGKGGLRGVLGRALGAPANKPQGRWVTDLIESSKLGPRSLYPSRVDPGMAVARRGARRWHDPRAGAGAPRAGAGAARKGAGVERAGTGVKRARTGAGRVLQKARRDPLGLQPLSAHGIPTSGVQRVASPLRPPGTLAPSGPQTGRGFTRTRVPGSDVVLRPETGVRIPGMGFTRPPVPSTAVRAPGRGWRQGPTPPDLVGQRLIGAGTGPGTAVGFPARPPVPSLRKGWTRGRPPPSGPGTAVGFPRRGISGLDAGRLGAGRAGAGRAGAGRAGAGRAGAGRAGAASGSIPMSATFGRGSRAITTPTKRWVPGTAVRAGDLPLEVGRRALLRVGGAMGIAGLLALDPFDAGDEDKVVAPTTKIENTNAMIEDRSKEYPGYDWLDDELPIERDLRELARYREDAGYDDFQDRSNQAWIGREDFPYTDEERDLIALEEERLAEEEEEAIRMATMNMSSGGIVGLQAGGRIPGDPTIEEIMAAAASLPPTRGGHGDRPWDPERHWENIPEGMEVQFGDLPSGPTLAEDREAGRTIWPWAGRRLKEAVKGAVTNPMIMGANPTLWGAALADPKNRARLRHGVETLADWTLPGYDPSIPLDEQKARIEGHGQGPAELVPIEGAESEEVPRENTSDIPDPDTDRAPSATEVGATAAERWADAQAALNKWGRTETPGEAALRRSMLQHADTTERDATTRFLMDVSSALRPGQSITEGLNRATQGQMDLRDKVAALRAIPLEVAAQRSRFDASDTDRIFENIFRAASSRGDIDANVEGQLEAAYAQIRQRGELTPEGLLAVEQIMRTLVEDKRMEPGQKSDYMNLLTQQLIGRLSGATGAPRIGAGREAGGIGMAPTARGVV